jgi:hypothetical protein
LLELFSSRVEQAVASNRVGCLPRLLDEGHASQIWNLLSQRVVGERAGFQAVEIFERQFVQPALLQAFHELLGLLGSLRRQRMHKYKSAG